MSCWSMVMAVVLACCGAGQKAAPVFEGTWTARVGPTVVLRGTWSAQVSEKSADVAQGSWTLLNEAKEIQLQGTWSVRKTAADWQGTWTAQLQYGPEYSGTWSADLADFDGKTLREMLERTMVNEVAGSWRRGRSQGYWWLKGLQPRGGSR